MVTTVVEAASKGVNSQKIVSRRPGDVQLSVSVAERAKLELGWEAKESLTSAYRNRWTCLVLSGN